MGSNMIRLKHLCLPDQLGGYLRLISKGKVILPHTVFLMRYQLIHLALCLLRAAEWMEKEKKDSQLNAEQTGEFVCSIVGHDQREAMNQTSIHLPYGQDEMPNAGLEGEAAELVKPLRVKNAPVHLECIYMQSVEMPCWHEGRENWVIFGEVVGIHVDPKIITDGLVDVTIYKPVSRLGYMDYSTVTDLFQMDRPD